MEIVIENQSETPSIIPSSTAYGTLPGPSGHPPSNFYYSTLPTRRSQHGMQTDQASVRRVDKSGLLEIPEPEPGRGRIRHLTGAESGHHSGTLPRRIDRLGLLEAVPEVPDQLQGQSSPEMSKSERHLTGAENDHKDQSRSIIAGLSPRTRSPIDVQPDNSTTVTSPYMRRQLSPKPADKEASNKFPSIDASRNNRYVDLTGASYTKARVNSPKIEAKDETEAITPDCLTKLSPRLRGDRQSSATVVSSVPDVIEAHGSKKCGDDNRKDKPEGERAEAEGCEHTAIESLEEARVSFKGTNKILHNDNIQTLRVIILSEQL